MSEANIHAVCGMAIREFPLKTGYGLADYLLYIDAKAAGTIYVYLIRTRPALPDHLGPAVALGAHQVG
jgi:hypothetical protein